MGIIRRSLGLCPQYDILWPEITVREHLEMYARFKGLPEDTIKAEVEERVREVGLSEKVDAAAGSLSGGQKRKLSVAIAFIGNPKVVFLDEPTSGMDPYSRRFTWDIIRKNKDGRAVVLTTHFMDEADILCDSIAIMAHGSLACVGPPLELKGRYLSSLVSLHQSCL
jgi:ABC-type multidrug transport system ATPase subunit